MEGCAAAEVGLAALAETYDMLVVATSSNGEGDPPYNFHAFLKALYAAQDEGGAAAATKVSPSSGFRPRRVREEDAAPPWMRHERVAAPPRTPRCS